MIPDHIIPTAEIDPLPVNLADRRDFQTILATTTRQVVLSRARRDSEGRLLGRSPLLVGLARETYLPRHAVPTHAFSETDRLMARPAEFAGEIQAQSATACWRNWHLPDLTPHDGPGQPTIRSRSRSSAAHNRPAHSLACCAIRSATCGSTGSAGANQRATRNHWCSNRWNSATWSTVFWIWPCEILSSPGGSPQQARVRFRPLSSGRVLR